MAYQAIYRKWRPLTFEDVVGQAHITETLKNELITKKVAHAYLFCGTRGTGKTTTAKILSRAINCENLTQSANPCNECPSCRGILDGTVMDVIEIDAASNNGVDNIRELRDEIIYTPASVKYKVYIIDEVHMLSTGAFNALLKTLEEPPAHAVFILATTEPHKIPATIQSRCQRFDFRRISNYHIAGRISEIARKDGIKIAADAINLVAALGDGSMRDALSILDLCSGISGEITKSDIERLTGAAGSEIIHNIARALIAGDMSAAVASVNDAVNDGRDIVNLAEELLGCFRELLICIVSSAAGDILDKSEEDLSLLKNLAAETSRETVIHAIKTLSDTVSVCKWASNPKAMLEVAMVKICSPELDGTSEAFAARIKKLESAVMLGAVVQGTADLNDTKQDKKTVDLNSKTDEKAPLPKPAEEKEAAPRVEQEWSSVIEAIKEQDAGAAALLIDTKSEIIDDTFFVIFNDDTLKDIAAKNKNLMNILKNAIKGIPVKLVTKSEYDSSAAKRETEPIDELLAKKSELGDQMTIL